MKQIFENWRRRIKENAYAMGTFGVNVVAGKPSSPCPQGEEQNGFYGDGTPFCRPKLELEGENKIIIDTRQEMIDLITANPNQKIYLDNPKGSVKKFGGIIPIELPFDYGYWPDFINPEDSAGWDLIIVPSATQDDHNLVPCGYVAYNENKPTAMGNDKIIIAPNGKYNIEDRKTIENVFRQMDYFDPVVWY